MGLEISDLCREQLNSHNWRRLWFPLLKASACSWSPSEAVLRNPKCESSPESEVYMHVHTQTWTHTALLCDTMESIREMRKKEAISWNTCSCAAQHSDPAMLCSLVMVKSELQLCSQITAQEKTLLK